MNTGYKIIRFIVYAIIYVVIVQLLYSAFRPNDNSEIEDMQRKDYVDFWKHRWSFIGAVAIASLFMSILVRLIPDASLCDMGLVSGWAMMLVMTLGLEFAILDVEREDDKKLLNSQQSIRLYEKNAFFIFYLVIIINSINMIIGCLPFEKQINDIIEKISKNK